MINLQLAQKKEARRKTLHWLFAAFCAGIIILFVILAACESPYLGWNYNDPETAVAGTVFHAAEWLFVRLAPLALAGGIVGLFLTRRKS